MSYDVTLKKDGTAVEVEPHNEGCIKAIGRGRTVADMSITYNYAEIYDLVNFSIRDLHERRAGDTIEDLKRVRNKLGTDAYTRDGWAPTRGNAGAALQPLIKWAKAHPDAVWEVT